MCLAVPGVIVTIDPNLDAPSEGHDADAIGREAIVDFGGTRVRVSLALVPQAEVGSWVLVHAGMALEELDREQAELTWRDLREAGVLGEERPAAARRR